MHVRMHERLIVWQEAYKLCLWMYEVAKTFPADERFGLTSQLRRSAMSIALNLAEGNARRSKREKTHFIDIAWASLEELHVELRLAHDLQYINSESFQKGNHWLSRISSLIGKLRASLQ